MFGVASLVNVVEQLDIRGLAEESLVEYLFIRVKEGVFVKKECIL
jgi:hypothetical protein